MSRAESGNPWIDIFRELQEEELEEGYGETWALHFNYSLTNDLPQEKRKQGWKVTERPSNGSFTCSSCHHLWNSARICIVFHYRRRENAQRGQVLMRPFRQQCRQCNSGKYEHPKFNEDRIEEILMGVIVKIKKNCYGVVDPDESPPKSPSDQRWTKPHHKELCEACQQGICTKA
ncbi:receptor-transporting protein 3-like [Ambystoma mexicanum]|uniref:receptor-transporting protein 3-like n=1 Tax=Ambystoma mexicanum TaxID=8296 RepID=UPI0037E92DEF